MAKFPVLCARDADHYVALANRIIADPAFKAATGVMGKQFFDAEINNAGYYAAHFLAAFARAANLAFAMPATVSKKCAA